MLNRRRSLIVALTLAVVLTGVGLGAAYWIKSPQQVTAEAAPPQRSVLTAQVERRSLVDTVVLRGKVGASGTFEVTPAPKSGTAVVTRVLTTAGRQVEPATVLLEVAGRPLIALPGSIPVYRDLKPGTHGPDVAQLQTALSNAGLSPGESDGEFGPGTKKAVADLYAKLGYEALPVDEKSAEALAAARDRVTKAERVVTAAREPTEAGYAREDLAAARRALADVDATTGPMVPATEVVFLPAFPARVDALKARVGAAVEAPLITLSSGALIVRANLNPAQRVLLREGMPVEVASETVGSTLRATIESIGDPELDAATSVRSHPMVIVAAEGAIGPELAGQDVRLTVEAAGTKEPVLAVPVSALYASADGRTELIKRDREKREVRVVVTAGATGNGYIEVTPVDGTLEPGDEVVVGAQPPVAAK